LVLIKALGLQASAIKVNPIFPRKSKFFGADWCLPGFGEAWCFSFIFNLFWRTGTRGSDVAQGDELPEPIVDVLIVIDPNSFLGEVNIQKGTFVSRAFVGHL